jgi:hypothetical protein
MLKALAGFIIGYWAGERRSAVAPQPEQSGASGWIGAFVILIATLAWGHVDLRPSHHPAQSANHAALGAHNTSYP